MLAPLKGTHELHANMDFDTCISPCLTQFEVDFHAGPVRWAVDGVL